VADALPQIHVLIALPLIENRARARSEALDDCGRAERGAVFDEADPSDSVMNGIDREAREARSDILTVFAYVVGKVTDVMVFIETKVNLSSKMQIP